MVPEGIFREGGDNFQIFAPYRMKEFQAPGMQMNAPVLAGTTGTIFPVSFDRPAGSGELGSYLMMPATEQQYLQQAIVCTISCNTVLECGFPGTGASRGNRSGNIGSSVAFEPVVERTAFMFRYRFYKSPIVFGGLPLPGILPIAGKEPWKFWPAGVCR